MAWEQLITFDIPEARWVVAGVRDIETTIKKQGYRCCKYTITSASYEWDMNELGWDLGAWPDSAFFCCWIYVNDVTKLGSSFELDLGYDFRFSYTLGSSPVYKTFTEVDFVNGWNFIAFPLSSMTNDSASHRQNAKNLIAYWSGCSTTDGSLKIYFDDFYVSTDKTKTPSREGAWQVRHYRRYSSSTNQLYAGILEPLAFEFEKRPSGVTEAKLYFSREALDSMPQHGDTVRLFRNCRCEFDGVVVRIEDDRLANTITLVLYRSTWLLQRLFDSAAWQIYVSSGGPIELFDWISYHSYFCDHAAGIAYEQQGWGFSRAELCMGMMPTLDVPDLFRMPKDESGYPLDVISKFRGQLSFDYDIRPPMVFNGYYPCKGYSWTYDGVTLYQDVDYELKKTISSSVDLANQTRALSRGGSTSWVGDAADTTSKNTYGKRGAFPQAQAISQTQINNAATDYNTEHKDPAIGYEITVLPGGWKWPWDEGDTIYLQVDGVLVPLRIYAEKVSVKSEGERLELVLQ